MSDKIKNIQDNLLPAIFNARQNRNWKALIEAIGQNDESVAFLIEQVKNEVFLKTSSGIYLERNGSNFGVPKPEGVAISDEKYREYVPIMSYYPKQIASTIGKLLQLFFSEEYTNAYIETLNSAPYNLSDGYDLSYVVDNYKQEHVIFESNDFLDITNATAEEVVAVINRSVKHSFANVIEDNINKGNKYIRIYTNTIGREGFIEINGGVSNIFMHFEGFNVNAGNGTDTEWNITKVGDLMKYKYIGNMTPDLYKVEAGDLIASIIPGNMGCFEIERVDLGDQSVFFRNPFGTAIVSYTQSSSNEVKFIKPYRSNVYKRLTRALMWEINPNEFKIEIPTSPSIMNKKLQGAIHLNGMASKVDNIPSNTTLELNNIDGWENTGTFTAEWVVKIPNQYVTATGSVEEDPTLTKTKRSFKETIYSYNGIIGNILQNISPNLPDESKSLNYAIVSGVRSSYSVTLELSSPPNDISIGDQICVAGSGALDGTFTVSNILTTPDRILYTDYRANDSTTSGYVLMDVPGLDASGHIIYQRSASSVDTFLGAYIYDTTYPYTLRSEEDSLQLSVGLGEKTKIIKTSGLGSLPNNEGYLVFEYGTDKEEGPVKYFYISGDTIFIDSTYEFQHSHGVGAIINLCQFETQKIRSNDYATYITDPSVAVLAFINAVKELKAAGIGSEFIIRHPNQYYEGYNIYEKLFYSTL